MAKSTLRIRKAFGRHGMPCLNLKLEMDNFPKSPTYKKAVLSQGNRAMPQLFFSV